MPNMPFPIPPINSQDIITDIEDWDPKVLDIPDSTSDKVAWVLQQGAVGAARKLVAIANGAHNYDYTERGATSALRIEFDACKYILETIHEGAAIEQPWQSWLRDMVKGENQAPKEPSGAELIMEGPDPDGR